MNKKIYIVTEGVYSDYHICAVFSTREKAEEYVQSKGTDYKIEEHAVDEEIKREVKLWRIVFILEYGEVKEACPTGLLTEDLTEYLTNTCQLKPTLFGEQHMYFYVLSETMDKAIKIASERLAAIKSNDYIWLRLIRPELVNGNARYEIFNVKTNEFVKK